MIKALKVVQYSALAAFNPETVTISQFSLLKPPFSKRADRQFAKSVCSAIAYEAGLNFASLKLTDLFVVCSIAVHRYKLKMRLPPAYNVLAERQV